MAKAEDMQHLLNASCEIASALLEGCDCFWNACKSQFLPSQGRYSPVCSPPVPGWLGCCSTSAGYAPYSQFQRKVQLLRRSFFKVICCAHMPQNSPPCRLRWAQGSWSKESGFALICGYGLQEVLKITVQSVCPYPNRIMFFRKLNRGLLRGTEHQPLRWLEGFILPAGLGAAMSSPGSRDRGIRWGTVSWQGAQETRNTTGWDLPTAMEVPRTGVWDTWHSLWQSCLLHHGWATWVLMRLFPLRMWWKELPGHSCGASSVLGGTQI